MRQLTYSLQFSGHAGPADASATVLKATTTAPSTILTTTLGPTGIRSELRPVAGDKAFFESVVAFTGQSAFQEAGTIAFGENGHRLRFSTVGEGYIGPSADSD